MLTFSYKSEKTHFTNNPITLSLGRNEALIRRDEQLVSQIEDRLQVIEEITTKKTRSLRANEVKRGQSSLKLRPTRKSLK